MNKISDLSTLLEDFERVRKKQKLCKKNILNNINSILQIVQTAYNDVTHDQNDDIVDFI
jgi:hypothetical protein